MSFNMEDIQKVQQYNALGMRLMRAMINAMPGKASNKVLDELQLIYEDYRNLFKQGPTSTPLFTERDVKAKMAETLEWIARTRDSMADWQGAVDAFNTAQQAFAELADDAGVKRCQEIIDKIHVAEGIDVDKRLDELLQREQAQDSQSLDYIRTLVELADLYAGSEDFFEANRYYQQALNTLQQQGRKEPSGDQLAHSLSSSIHRIMNGNADSQNPDILETMNIRDLYRQIYMGQIRVFRALSPERVAAVDAKLKALEGGDRRTDFTEELKKIVQGSFGDLLK